MSECVRRRVRRARTSGSKGGMTEWLCRGRGREVETWAWPLAEDGEDGDGRGVVLRYECSRLMCAYCWWYILLVCCRCAVYVPPDIVHSLVGYVSTLRSFCPNVGVLPCGGTCAHGCGGNVGVA